MTFFCVEQNSVKGIRDLCGWRGRTRSVAEKKKVTALHCNLFSRIKYYAYTKYIVLIREQVQTTSTTFKIKCKKKKGTSWQWYMKWVYLNNLRNICFICYFLYLNLNEILFSYSHHLSAPCPEVIDKISDV